MLLNNLVSIKLPCSYQTGETFHCSIGSVPGVSTSLLVAITAVLRYKRRIGSAKTFLSIPQLLERINLLPTDFLSLSIKRFRVETERISGMRCRSGTKKKRKQNIGFTANRDLMRK